MMDFHFDLRSGRIRAVNATEQKQAARLFAETWKNRGHERAESQPFWLSLLRNVFGVTTPESFIEFETPVQLEHTSFIDGIIAETNVVIEQKGVDKDLRKPERQSDGSLLTPFEQAKRYSESLKYSRRPRWIVTCNFRSFLVYDMDKPDEAPQEILLGNLEHEYWRLSFLVDREGVHIQKEVALSLEAGRIIGKVHGALKQRYVNPDNPESQRSLGMLCVRLVFCLFAEDAGLFGTHSSFGDYLARFPADVVRNALKTLFEVLDTPVAERDPYLGEILRSFPYVNGGLFHDRDVEIPDFTEELKSIIVHDASETFDWSQISPTIFGAVFDSTLAPRERHETAGYYTSVENIHRVIDPLFLDKLNDRLARILDGRDRRQKTKSLEAFLEELGNLCFLDPAAGSGNFLTETFLSLRRLENRALSALLKEGVQIDHDNAIHVRLDNFFGIENNPFACAVARASLWIAQCQMLEETEGIIHQNLDCLPLHTSASIVFANALRIDWNKVVPSDRNPFIVGNPPFVGSKYWTAEQAKDMREYVFSGIKHAGTLDYVAAWYWKAVDYMKGTKSRAAFVSTNSIVQGEQPGILFDPLFEKGMTIDFAWRPFRWNSESLGAVTVSCVIIGFHVDHPDDFRILFDSNGRSETVRNLNAYLVDGPNLTIKNRSKPICNIPQSKIGNKPIDGGNYLFSEEEKTAFLKKEPGAEKFFMPWVGGDELIYGYYRHCLFLANATPKEIKSLPEVRKRIAAVKAYRLESSDAGTRRLAEQPTRFHVTNIPTVRSLVIPEVSSEGRAYIPMAFFDSSVLCSNLVKVIPDATIYHFGVLTSSTHMAWMRAVCGRREMRYRYSTRIVYNNFPWPSPTSEQRKRIEETAQAILDVRAAHPESTLDALYDPVSMPYDLLKAHRANDEAVLSAYALDKDLSEVKIVSAMLSLYQMLAETEAPERRRRPRRTCR